MVGALTDALRRANENLNAAEQIRRFTIVAGPWLPGGDELTPTMKLKRKPIAAKHAALIDACCTERSPMPFCDHDGNRLHTTAPP